MNNKGSILAIVIIFIFIFTLLGMFAMRLVVLQNETSDSELYYTRSHFAALYGTELALWRIMQWENIPTASTNLNTDGRKFLAENSTCFDFSSGKWHPLKGYTGNADINGKFTDSITGGIGSGILLECSVEEEVPDPNDGFIPDTNPASIDQKYGKYKFYVIKTVATMYGNATAKTGAISEANDQLHFFIAYSTGSAGAAYTSQIQEKDSAGNVINTIPALPVNSPEYVVSAQYPSMITGKILPIFRYYIRGRR